MCFDFSYNFCLKHFSFYAEDVIINVHTSSRKVPVMPVRF